jgi:hypothetical protein
MADRSRRALAAGELIAAVMWHGGKVRDAVLANEDVKRVQELIREDIRKNPDSADEWTWVMLSISYPEEAKTMVDAMAGNERMKASRALRDRMAPLSGSRALRGCWALEMSGKHREAVARLRTAASAGVPMPFDLP